MRKDPPGSQQGGQSTDCSLLYITGQEKRFIKKSAGTIGFLQNEILKLVIQQPVFHLLLREAELRQPVLRQKLQPFLHAVVR